MGCLSGSMILNILPGCASPGDAWSGPILNKPYTTTCCTTKAKLWPSIANILDCVRPIYDTKNLTEYSYDKLDNYARRTQKSNERSSCGNPNRTAGAVCWSYG